MRIRNQFILSTAVFSVVLLIVVASLILMNQEITKLDQQQNIAGNIEQGADELNILSSQFFLYQQPQQLFLWQSNITSIAGNLTKLNPSNYEQKAFVNNATTHMAQLNASFTRLVSFLETAPRNVSVRIMPEFQNDWNLTVTEHQKLSQDASGLSNSLRSESDQMRTTNTVLIIVLLGAFGAFFLTNYFITYRRTLKSISNLQAGLNVIGSGNLDYSVNSGNNDEIGDLSSSFNQMTANLKMVTATKEELEKEIAERKKAEEQLKASQIFLEKERNILDTIMSSPKNIHLVYLDTNFNFVHVNEAYAKTCGYTPEEMIGKNYFALYSDKENEAIFAGVRDTGILASYHDKPFIFPDQPDRGVTFWDWTLGAVKDETGKTEGLVFSLVETTERKQSEEALLLAEKRYRRLYETSQDGIMARDLQGHMIDCNQAYARMLGYSKGELENLAPQQLIPEKWHEERERILKEVVDQGGSIVFEREYKRKDGSIFPASVRTWRIVDEKGKTTGTWSIVRDITEQKELQKRLQQHAENLENLVEERTKQLNDAERMATIGQTAGMVGHDIRNPLQAIIGDVYLLKADLSSMLEDEEKESVEESLVGIEKNLNYINKIILDLQDYAKPLNPIAQETDLEDLFEELLMKSDIPKNIKASCRVETDTKIIQSDPGALKRIFSNLITNAVQAMPKGGRLSLTARKESNDTIIVIQDNGEGIPEAVKPKLFTPLFTTKSKGQGFGLAVVKRMTEALGGSITLESNVGKGTKFIIHFPTKETNAK